MNKRKKSNIKQEAEMSSKPTCNILFTIKQIAIGNKGF